MSENGAFAASDNGSFIQSDNDQRVGGVATPAGGNFYVLHAYSATIVAGRGRTGFYEISRFNGQTGAQTAGWSVFIPTHMPTGFGNHELEVWGMERVGDQTYVLVKNMVGYSPNLFEVRLDQIDQNGTIVNTRVFATNLTTTDTTIVPKSLVAGHSQDGDEKPVVTNLLAMNGTFVPGGNLTTLETISPATLLSVPAVDPLGATYTANPMANGFSIEDRLLGRMTSTWRDAASNVGVRYWYRDPTGTNGRIRAVRGTAVMDEFDGFLTQPQNRIRATSATNPRIHAGRRDGSARVYDAQDFTLLDASRGAFLGEDFGVRDTGASSTAYFFVNDTSESAGRVDDAGTPSTTWETTLVRVTAEVGGTLVTGQHYWTHSEIDAEAGEPA